MTRTIIMALGLLGGSLAAPTAMLTHSTPKPSIEARLTLLTQTLHEEDRYTLRVEIENVSEQVLLVGRDMYVSDNWPFRVEIQLEDSFGNQYGMGGASFIDPRPTPDFSLEHGILRWWLPLAPHTFMGIYIHSKLAGVPPGKYRLHGTYISLEPSALTGAPPAEASNPSKFPVFEGTVETNSIWIQVLPKTRQSGKHSKKN